MATTRANYVKIGVFVSLAVMMAVAAAIVLGAGAFNENELLMETYIEDSVQGLDVGSPVKFRGIPVGKITEITFVWPTYIAPETPEGKRAMHYARVVFTVENKCVDEVGCVPFENLVDDGLRIFVKNQGITGLMYLNMDFPNNTFAKTTLPVPWEPEHPYIPSAPGLGKAVTDVIENLSDQLSALDLRESLASLSEILASVREDVRAAKLGESGKRLNDLLTHLDGMAADFDMWRKSAELDDKAASAFVAAASLEKSAKALEAALPGLLESAGGLTENLNAATRESRTQVAESLDNIRRAAETLNEVLEKLKERPSLLLRDPSAD